jgi:hypothetical protein
MKVYRFRKQRVVNLGMFLSFPLFMTTHWPGPGSWSVFERWNADNPFRFACAPAQSDLDIARGKNARQMLEVHWDTWVKDDR